MTLVKGGYRPGAHTRIKAPADSRAREIANFLRAAMREQTGIAVSAGTSTHDIELRIDPSVHGEEAYQLAVTPQRVTVSAATYQPVPVLGRADIALAVTAWK